MSRLPSLLRLCGARHHPVFTCRTVSNSANPGGDSPAALAKPAVDNPALSEHDFFGVHRLFTVSDLFGARVHLGHTHRSVDPRMRRFLVGRRFDTAVIDLDQTALHLRQALNFLAHLSSLGGIVLFVSRQPHLTHLVERAAADCGEYAHCRAWRREVFTAPQKQFGGEVRLPDAVVLLHTRDGVRYTEHGAVVDAAKAGVPTVAVVDSDCNPNLITYPIPGNDDTVQSVQLYLSLFQQAIRLGKSHRQRQLKLDKEEEGGDAVEQKAKEPQ